MERIDIPVTGVLDGLCTRVCKRSESCNLFLLLLPTNLLLFIFFPCCCCAVILSTWYPFSVFFLLFSFNLSNMLFHTFSWRSTREENQMEKLYAVDGNISMLAVAPYFQSKKCVFNDDFYLSHKIKLPFYANKIEKIWKDGNDNWNFIIDTFYSFIFSSFCALHAHRGLISPIDASVIAVRAVVMLLLQMMISLCPMHEVHGICNLIYAQFFYLFLCDFLISSVGHVLFGILAVCAEFLQMLTSNEFCLFLHSIARVRCEPEHTCGNLLFLACARP